MKYRVQMTPTASREFEWLDVWWKSNRDKNPFLFADEVYEAIEFLEKDPEGGFSIKSRVGEHFRRMPLEGSRNQVYYWHQPGDPIVWIVSFWGGPKRGRPRMTLEEIP